MHRGGFAPGSGYGILTKRPKPESVIGNPEGVHHGCWININTGKVIFSTPTGADLFGGNYFQYEDPCVTAPAMGR